jgi:hypothetical protein
MAAESSQQAAGVKSNRSQLVSSLCFVDDDEKVKIT